MKTSSTSLTHDDLLQQMGWIRSLAGSLVREASDAEDVAQETVLACLRKPPPLDRPLRPWLVVVITNLVRRLRRSDTSRVRRELAMVAAGEGPSPADLVERTELHRALVDEVLALGEPQRSIVILHYYDDLPLVEIARRKQLPSATVRSHLLRARQSLRQRLEDRNDRGAERTSFLLGSLAAPIASGHGGNSLLYSFSKGWVLMTAVKVAGSILVITVAAAVGWEFLSSDSAGAQPLEVIVPDAPAGAEQADPVNVLVADGKTRAPASAAQDATDDTVVSPDTVEALEAAASSLPEMFQALDAFAFKTLDGTLLLADAYDLAIELLANIDPEAGTWGEDGRRVFELFEDEELGSARLLVAPGKVGSSSEFWVDVRTSSIIGHDGAPRNSSGSKLGLHFGTDGESITAFRSHTEIQFEQDPRGRHVAPGERQIGGHLRMDGSKVTWQRQTLDSTVDESGARKGRITFGHPESPFVGELTDGRARELASQLVRFRVR